MAIIQLYSFAGAARVARFPIPGFAVSAQIQGKDDYVARERSIAVIDDDASFRVALVESLSSLGYSARGFSSAEEFIAGNGTEPYDCAITDIYMPGMSGFDLIQQLLARHSSLPVIMITADGEPGLEARATAVGAVCLLRKPFEAAALTDCLERAMKI